MIFVEALLGLLALLLLVPIILFFLQVSFALLPGKITTISSGKRPSVAVLMPAHNEALVLAETLSSIIPQLVEGDRILIVADNCSDDTAKIGTAAGAEVVERFNLENRGKSYALEFGMHHMLSDPAEVVIIIDADCFVPKGVIDKLARACAETDRPIQSLYLMKSPQGAGLKVRVAEFAWLVKNLVRPLGLFQLGLPCQLMGTGMAFPWKLISKVSLASGHLVEDMKLGLDLTRMGKPPLFCAEALVTSVFPDSVEGTQTQRTRWEHGHLGMIISEAPKLILQAVFELNGSLFALVMDMCIPPLALILILTSALFGLATVLFLAGG